MSLYETGLDRNAANYVPLSPLSFLARSARVYPDRLSLIHGPRRFTWQETYERWLSSPAEIERILRGSFQPDRFETRWGFLTFVGRRPAA